MKLLQVRPCDKCGCALGTEGAQPAFHVVRYSMAIADLPEATQARLAGSEATCVVVMDSKLAVAQLLTTELVLCEACYGSPINLASLAEEQMEHKRREAC